MAAMLLVLCCAALIGAADAVGLASETCDASRRAVVLQPDAEAFIGVIMSMHGNSVSGGHGCDASLDNMQAYEAMRWALSRINQESGFINGLEMTKSYIPGVKIGLKIRDSCSKAESGTQALLDFLPNIHSKQQWCNVDSSKLFLGVTGGMSSDTTATVHDILKDYKFGQISFTTTSASLNNKRRYPFIMKTSISNSMEESMAMSGVLQSMNWTYISVVYTDTTHGRDSFEQFLKVAQEKHICVTMAKKIAEFGNSQDVVKALIQSVFSTQAAGVVFLGSEQAATELLSMAASVEVAGLLHWFVPFGVENRDDVVRHNQYARGLLTMSPTTRHIAEFEDHWVQLDANSPPADSPWYKEWYMTVNRCRLTGVNYPPFESYSNCPQRTKADRREKYRQTYAAEAAILSVYSFAKALKEAHAQLCGSNYKGLCGDLAKLSPVEFYNTYLKTLDFTFSQDERIASLASSNIEPWKAARRVRFDGNGNIRDPPSYDIWNFNNADGDYTFRKIGVHQSGVTSVKRNEVMLYNMLRDKVLFNRPISTCSVNACDMCLATNDNAPPGMRYAYKPGSLIVAATFSIHEAGDGPFSCGAKISEVNGGAQMAEAFFYALERVGNLRILHDGVSLGGLVFDDCMSERLARSMQTNVATGALKLTSADDADIDPGTISAYVESHTGALSESSATALNGLDATVVGQWSTVGSHADSSKLLRAVPDVSMHAKTLVLMLKKMNWSYVQLVYSSDARGQTLAKLLRNMTSLNSICISAEHEITAADDTYETAINNIGQSSETSVIIIVANSDLYTKLMKVFTGVTADGYTFVCSIDWGDEDISLTGLENSVTEGSLMVNTKVEKMDGFVDYINGINVIDNMYNPWASEWYQLLMNCYLDERSKDGHSTACEKKQISTSADFQQNVLNNHIANAVEAIARGLHETLKVYCGDSYSSVCYSYKQSPKRADVMHDHVGASRFENEAGNTFSFVNNEGNVPLEIFNVHSGSVVKVGEFIPGSGDFSLDANNIRYKRGVPVTPRCAGRCSQCDYVYATHDYQYTDGDILIGGIFDVHTASSTLLACGDMNDENGYPFVEAFMYAIEQVNKGTGPVRSLNGVKLGGIALDACASPVRAADSVAAFMAGTLQLRNDAIERMDSSKLVSWLTHLTTATTVEVGDVNRDLNTAQILLASMPTVLVDRKRFPTLFSMQASDCVVADGIMRLAQHMGWKYVNSVSTADDKGRKASKALKEAGKRVGICVVDIYELGTDGKPAEIVQKLQSSTTDIVVLLTSISDIFDMLAAKTTAVPSADQLVFIAYDYLNQFDAIPSNLTSAANNILVYKSNTPSVQDFDDYLSKKLPAQYSHYSWFYHYYQHLYDCNLEHSFEYERPCVNVTKKSLTHAEEYMQSGLVLNVINAVYANAHALDALLKDVCGEGYSGVCQKFRQMDNVRERVIDKLEVIAFTDQTRANVKFVDRKYDQGHAIYRYGSDGKAYKIATFKDNAFSVSESSLRESYKSAQSECGSRCVHCQQGSTKEEEFVFSNGDFIIGGIFDVHHKGASPFTCGKINHDQGFQLLEAFNYAIGVVNNNRGLFKDRLKGITVGGLSLDTCSSSTRAGNLVANLHSGYLSLKPDSGQVDPGKIDIYVGGFESDMSMKIADVLNDMDISQISYGSTNMQLRDRQKYPHFLRTIPADDKHARAVISLLKRFDISYVQVVNSPNIDDTQAAAEFIKLASARDICVAQNITFGPGEMNNAADNVVDRLQNKKAASVVIVYLDSEYIGPFLQAIHRNGAARASKFRFIGSQKWADSLLVLNGDVGDVASDSITLGVETADLPDFDGYLIEKKPVNADETNPWFDEYYQDLLQCSLPGESKYTKTCDVANPVKVVHASDYSQDPYVLYTVNAVYSAALGLDIAMRKACGDDYDGLCDDFLKAGDRRQQLLDGIRKARFLDATKQIFEFNDAGESNRGYHIYTIKRRWAGDGYFYDNVGTYNDQDMLTINNEFSINWRSACANDVCEECPQIGRRRTKYMQKTSDVNIVGFFDVHSSADDNLSCGPMDTDYGFQHALAFFYAIGEVNADKNRLPDLVDVGGIAADTCGNPLRTTMDIFSILSSGQLNQDTSIDRSSILAFLTMGDDNSQAAVSLLSPINITTISPSAKSDALDGTPYFLRTTPSQTQQAAAMADIASKMKWNYVTLINTDDEDNNAEADAYIRYVKKEKSGAQRSSTCIANQYKLGSDATIEDVRALVRKLMQNRGSNVLMLFTSPQHTRLLLRAIRDEGLTNEDVKGRFVLVGSGAWGNNSEIVANVEEAARGAISLQAKTSESAGFRKYVQNLTVAEHGAIPDDWFDDFWQFAHKCRLENATVVHRQFTRVCSVNERLTSDMIPQSGTLHTIIATQILAIALYDVKQCYEDGISLQSCRQAFFEELKSSHWTPYGGDSDQLLLFRFRQNTHGNLGYQILNYQKDDTSFTYKQIGTYQEKLELDKTAYKSYDANGNIRENEDFVSNCPIGSLCSCENNTGNDGFANKDGGPDTGAQKSLELNDNFNTVWGIVLTVLTIIGIVVTLLMFVYLIIVYPVKGGTTILGYLLLFGVLLIYVLNFAFLLVPTEDVCGIRRFCLGFVYAICFACMLLKVLNTWRVGSYYEDDYAPPPYDRLAHPASLFFIAVALTCVQVAIGVEWLVLDRTAVEDDRCAPKDTHYEELIMSCIYVMVLMLLTLIFSMVTWDSEENHSESKFVLATTCFTIAIWIAWTLVATLAAEKYQDPAVIISNLVNATVILVLLFVRKLYLLSQFEKEIKEEDKRSRISSIANGSRKDGDVFHNVSYVNDMGTGSRPGSHMGGSAVLYFDPHLAGGDTVY